MIVWRISNYLTLDGVGGLKASGRWHSRGRPIVYCALEPASALLEMLVCLEIDMQDWPTTYRLLKIEIPDAIGRERLPLRTLPAGWRGDPGATRRIGDDWLLKGRSAVLLVPSAIVPVAESVLINPAHAKAADIRLLQSQKHALDPRLVRAAP